MTDQELILQAIADLQRIAAEYIEPGPRDAEATIEKMLEILDRNDIVAAAARLAAGFGIRVAK